MGKIDWPATKVLYVTRDSISYGDIAKKYGVAKSTVVRHATKECWPEKRRKYNERRVRELESRSLEDRVEAEERQLRTLRITQAFFHNRLLKLAVKQQTEGAINGKDVREMADATGAMIKAINAERVILELPTKPVVLRSPDDIDAYLIAAGLKDEPAINQYEEIREAIQDLDRLIENRKRLKSYLDEG